MCSSAALGIFPSPGEGGIFPVDASRPLFLSHIFPFPPFPVLHQATATLSCLPSLPPSTELNPKIPPASFPKAAERAGKSSRGAEL